MQYTTNYNLGLVEGTDLVNPMTQINPNFSDLDTIIKTVDDNTITTAVEVTVGGVHGLTRTNPNATTFKWIATANYNTGDTFTVDGVSVTALKTNGTILQTGEYIIGAAVIGILDGTRLTLFVAQNISQTATDITYDNTGSGLSGNNVQLAIDEVVTMIEDIDTVTLTPAAGINITYNAISLLNMVYITGVWTGTIPSPSGHIPIATVQTGFRPLSNVNGTGVIKEAGTSISKPGFYYINASGEITQGGTNISIDAGTFTLIYKK